MKITIIGAGGYVFPLTEIRDILSFPALQDATLCLFDIDAKRLKNTEKGARGLVEMFNLPATIEATTNRREALKDTDVAICTFQVGGLAAYKLDVEIPRKYGIDQTVGDTLGPGGVFRGLRSMAVFTEMAVEWHHLCPDALLLQYANPMSINCLATEALGIQTVGLCHSVQGTSDMLAREAGYPIGECAYVCGGVNHMAWFVRFEHKRRDILPEIERAVRRAHLEAPAGQSPERVRASIMNLTGYFHSESSHHASEYTPWFRKTARDTAFYMPKRWDYYQLCSTHDVAGQAGHFVKDAKEKGLKPSHEYGAYIIDSLATNTPRLIHGNVPNTGLIPNLPDGCCVEVPCHCDALGVRGMYVGELPEACAAMNRQMVNVHTLATTGGLRGDRDAIHAAIALDPYTSAQCTLPQIHQMVDDLFKAERRWLPQFKGTKPKYNGLPRKGKAARPGVR